MKTLDLLAKLVSINSVFPDEQRISSFLSDYLAKLGFSIKHVVSGEGRNNIVAVYGEAKHYLGFYAHMDTIPAAAGWKGDPWKMWLEKNLAYGLGVVDMKGGLVAILQAGAYAISKQLPVKIVLGVDEENDSQGAHDLVDSGELGDIDFLIVAESGQVKNLKQPYSLCFGRKGRIVFEVEVHGKTAHAAESEKGINAIEQAAALLLALKEQPFAPHPKFGRTTMIVQRIAAESGAFSVPEVCILKLSLLTTPNEKSTDFSARVQQTAARLGIDVRIDTAKRKTPYGESYELPLDDKFVRLLQSIVFDPDEVRGEYMPSVADENVFANKLHIPVLTLGPIGGGDHTKSEWLNIDSLVNVIAVYQKILDLYQTNHR